jgi:subtilisin family serine protease
VLNGLNWILANKSTYGSIRVVNMSFGAKPQSFYWNDPIDQAVMKLWQAGIVVVASAGNFGPTSQSISVPGNTPYVITVGAMTDNNTPSNTADDGIASFSSAGPTYEGFIKPDIVAPGGHLAGLMDKNQQLLAATYPQFQTDSYHLFIMSGTSQAAAVTSGVVALMLQTNPTLTPDNLKCRLMAAARPAITSTGTLAYSVFQQGAGLINAVAAVNASVTGCANVGLDVAADLAGTVHVGGPANQDESGNYYVTDLGASVWGTPLTDDGYTWSRGYTWSPGYTWSRALLWWDTTGVAAAATS